MAASMPELVDYAYIAEKLNVSQQTVRVYATGTKQRKAGFPESVAPKTARSPLFRKKDADAFIQRRLTETAGDTAPECRNVLDAKIVGDNEHDIRRTS